MIKPTTRHKVYIKSKLSAWNVLIWHEHTLANACAIHQWLHPPRQTAAVHATPRWDAPSVRWCHEFSFGTPFAASYPRFYSQQDSDLGCWVTTDLVRRILEYHIEEAEECLVLCVCGCTVLLKYWIWQNVLVNVIEIMIILLFFEFNTVVWQHN